MVSSMRTPYCCPAVSVVTTLLCTVPMPQGPVFWSPPVGSPYAPTCSQSMLPPSGRRNRKWACAEPAVSKTANVSFLIKPPSDPAGGTLPRRPPLHHPAKQCPCEASGCILPCMPRIVAVWVLLIVLFLVFYNAFSK